MPKKFSMVAKREWLELYESGKTERWIATEKAHCDVRTVKKGIEEALRKRDANAARIELLKDAIRGHQDELRSLINRLTADLAVPPSNVEFRGGPDENPPPIGLAGGTATYENEKGWTVSLHVENSVRWDLLQEHLKRDPMWNMLARWKKAIAAHMGARVAIKRKTASLLEGKTGLSIATDVHKAPKAGYLYPIVVDLFYGAALNRALGIPQETNLREEVVVTSDGYVEHGQEGTRLAYSPGFAQKCKNKILAAFTELQTSLEASEVMATYKAADESSNKARRVVLEVSSLNLVPGQCRVCRRLGM